MKKEMTYKASFYAWIGIILMILFLSIQANCQIPKDKQSHLLAGSFIGFSTASLTINAKPEISFICVLGSSTLIGGGKELIYDKWMGKGTPEFKDFAYTVAGGITGYAIVRGFKFACERIGRNKRYKKVVIK